eukprot:scaffold56308_cov61-Phaeocystis_antarctica.AAC.9
MLRGMAGWSDLSWTLLWETSAGTFCATGSSHKGVRVTCDRVRIRIRVRVRIRILSIGLGLGEASTRNGLEMLQLQISPETSGPIAWPSAKQVRLTPVTAPVAFFAYFAAIIFARARFALCCVKVKNMPRPKSRMSMTERLCKSGRERRAQSNTLARQPAVMHACRPKSRDTGGYKKEAEADRPRAEGELLLQREHHDKDVHVRRPKYKPTAASFLRVAGGSASTPDQPKLKAVQAWPANSAEHSAAETPSDFSLGPFRSGGVGNRLLYTSASPAMPADPTLSHRHPTVHGMTSAGGMQHCKWQLGALSDPSSAPVS